MMVIKIGGAAGNDWRRVLDDLGGRPDLAIVHGGSQEVDDLAAALGVDPRIVTSPSGHTSRYTDGATMEVLAMALAGRVNVRLVADLHRRGIPAVGLCGVDGGLLRGRRKGVLYAKDGGRTKVLRGDHSGILEAVNADLLRTLMDGGFLPVVSPPGVTAEGELINVDADRAAAAVAGALGAEALVIFTNVPGLLRDPADPSSLIPAVLRAELPAAMDLAYGRMKRKLVAASEALGAGVGRVIIADPRVDHPLAAALGGRGTVIA